MTAEKKPLDPIIAEMERKWRDSGIPGIYAGGNGPVSRERAHNIRALLYPKPKLPAGRIERSDIPGPNGPITVEIVRPVEGASRSARWFTTTAAASSSATSTATRHMRSGWPTPRGLWS
jgi:hypothetical protein